MPRKLFLLALCALAALPAAAHAAAPKLAVQPVQSSAHSTIPVTYFDVRVSKGERVRLGHIRVTNRGAQAVTVVVDPVGASTAANLGFAYDVAGGRDRRPARWIETSAHRLSIAPRRSALIPVTVTVPRHVAPGDHLAGVSIEATGQRQTPASDDQVAVSSAQRYVVGVEMRVPGPRHPHIDLVSAKVDRKPAGVTFLTKAANDGNAILTGVTGNIQVFRAGRRVARTKLGPGTFVTGTRVQVPLLAQAEHPEAGTRYRVRATMHYPGGDATLDDVVVFGRADAERQDEFTQATPAPAPAPENHHWLLVLAALALLGIVVALVVRRRRRKRQAVPELEDLVEQLRLRGLAVVPVEDGERTPS
jgi:hypothetical protein